MKIGYLKLNKVSVFILVIAILLLILVFGSLLAVILEGYDSNFWLKVTAIIIAGILSFQGLFTLFWMLYAWEDPEKMAIDSAPELLNEPKTTFTLLVPARFENEVIAKTLQAIAEVNYPDKLFETLVLCKSDDPETIAIVNKTIEQLGKSNMKLVVFESDTASKPIALNIGAKMAKGEMLGIFDAEDEPKKELLRAVDTIYQQERPSVIQGGVQLMNLGTNWYSTLNVLEYYFWFKSALHLFSRLNVIPLGGNTVFFNKKEILELGGWKDCLTEDAEIGFRFSLANKDIRVFYEPELVTEEECPSSLSGFLKQRSRWNQGFLQILLEGSWRKFDTLKKKIFALYFLLLPQLTALNLVFILASYYTLFIKLPLFSTLLVISPLYILVLQLLTQLLALREFSKDFNKKVTIFRYLVVIISFIPYQFLLAFSAMRAMIRQLIGCRVWEKTLHKNLHRT